MLHRPWASYVDMYRKVPVDLMEGSRRGSILSYLALIVMAVLFLLETKAYFTPRVITDLSLDNAEYPRIRLDFNITVMDLKCDWAVIDVVSALGTDQNVTAHVTKWKIDANGVKQGYRGRNRNQKDVVLYDETVTETIEQLHANGEDAINLDEETLKLYIEEYDYVFVDFFASWCSHCRDLAPTWETLAEVMVDAGEHLGRQHPDDYSEEEFEAAERIKMPVVIAKVDCVSHPTLCNQEQNVRAYPTLRLFVDGKPWVGGDYFGHRTVLEMVEWLYYIEEKHKKLLDESNDKVGAKSARTLHVAHTTARERINDNEARGEEERRWRDAHLDRKRRKYYEWKEEEHPGCMLAGFLNLDRAPGNFHILARSNQHDLAPHMTNISHMVNSLRVGSTRGVNQILAGNGKVPKEVVQRINPMDGNVYTTYELHESYHHYLKLVSTQSSAVNTGISVAPAYQIIHSSQLSYYSDDMVPEAKFSYDLSPIAVNYRTTYRHWYDYITSIMAIIGGVFTVVGMIESTIAATVSMARKRSVNLR